RDAPPGHGRHRPASPRRRRLDEAVRALPQHSGEGVEEVGRRLKAIEIVESRLEFEVPNGLAISDRSAPDRLPKGSSDRCSQSRSDATCGLRVTTSAGSAISLSRERASRLRANNWWFWYI